MRSIRCLAVLALAGALIGVPSGAGAQTYSLVDGRDWQRSGVEQKRAYLIGVSNAISIGARYDQKKGAADSFTLTAQRGLSGTHLSAAVEKVDAWYKAHPSDLEKPVLSIVWAELARLPPLGLSR